MVDRLQKGRAGKSLDLPPCLWKIMEVQRPEVMSKGNCNRFTIWTLYIMMIQVVMTIFTILTTTTTFTIWQIFQYRSQLRTIQSKAATKIDALSGEPAEDIDQSPLFFVDGKQQEVRRDVRKWKASCKDASLR